MKEIIRAIFLILIMGFIYMYMEILYKGNSSILMIPIGGCSAFLVGIMDERFDYFYNKKVIEKCFVGAIYTLTIEFISGCIFNIWLGMNLWSYVGMPLNILGQICLPYGIIWFFLIPLGLFLNNLLRQLLFKESEPTTGLLEYYKDLFTLK